MVSYHPAKFDGHRHWVSGDMFLVVEEQDSSGSHLNLPLLFITKAHGMLCSHTRNFIITRTLVKMLPSVSNEISPIIVTHDLGNE